MKSFLFRCDSSSDLGSGHVKRCLNLAGELSYLGANVIFACRDFEKNIISSIEEKYKVINLPRFLSYDEGKYQDERDLIQINNKVVASSAHQILDSNTLVNNLLHHGMPTLEWLIVDHYSFDYIWHSNFRDQYQSLYQQTIKVLSLEDFANKSIACDAVLDQNYNGNDSCSRYSGLLLRKCVELYGPHYALLGPEYRNTANSTKSNSKLKKCLVFFGGSDKSNFTQKAIKALSSPEFRSIDFNIIIGKQNCDAKMLTEMCVNKANISICPPVNSLYEMIQNSDFAIGAGGTTTWERACLNLPSIVVSLSTNQYYGSKKLAEDSFIYFLGKQENVAPEQISHAISGFINNKVFLNPTNLLTDSFGALRVAHYLLPTSNLLLFIRVKDKHVSTLFNWSNDSDVRQNSFTPNLISPQDHIQWLAEGLLDSNRIHYIGVDSFSLCPVGQIRFDLDKKKLFAEIDISVDKIFRGKGYSSQLLDRGIQRVLRIWGHSMHFRARILYSNFKSQSVFQKCGFKEVKKYKKYSVWVYEE